MVNYAYLDVRGYWGFYSSEVLPPFLITQVVSLQNSPFRNPKRGGQVIHREESAVFKVFLQYFSNTLPYSYWALISSGIPHKEWARLSFGPWTWTSQARQASPPIFILFNINNIIIIAWIYNKSYDQSLSKINFRQKCKTESQTL